MKYLQAAWSHLPAWLRDALDPYHSSRDKFVADTGDAYVHHRRSAATVTLEGEFTAAQLRDIATVMEADA